MLNLAAPPINSKYLCVFGRDRGIDGLNLCATIAPVYHLKNCNDTVARSCFRSTFGHHGEQDYREAAADHGNHFNTGRKRNPPRSCAD